MINNGTIRNNPKAYELWLDIKGNLINNGTWTNAKNTLSDTVDETVFIADPKIIAAPFFIDALWTSGPYKWQKDGEDLAATSKTLMFDTISSAVFGTYQCIKNDLVSRIVVIHLIFLHSHAIFLH